MKFEIVTFIFHGPTRWRPVPQTTFNVPREAFSVTAYRCNGVSASFLLYSDTPLLRYSPVPRPLPRSWDVRLVTRILFTVVFRPAQNPNV